jgi:hypothetical protein
MNIEISDIELIERYIFDRETLKKEEIDEFELKVKNNPAFNAHVRSLIKISDTLLEDHYSAVIDNLILKKKRHRIWFAVAASLAAILSISFYYFNGKQQANEITFKSYFIPYNDKNKDSFGIASSKSSDSLEILLKIVPLSTKKYLFDDTLRLQLPSHPHSIKLVLTKSNEYWLDINSQKTKIKKTIEWTNF